MILAKLSPFRQVAASIDDNAETLFFGAPKHNLLAIDFDVPALASLLKKRLWEMSHDRTPLFESSERKTTEANEEFAEASRSTAIDSRNGILTEVLGQLLGRGKQPKSKLVCFPKETKYTREDSNLQPSVPKTDALSS